MAAGLREKLVGLVEPLLSGLGYELVDLECSGSRGSSLVRIFIDRAAGVGIEDCELISREVSALLDVHDPVPTAYRLEVSTPGFDRVLRTPAHFARFQGAQLEVELVVPRDGRRRYTGRLLSRTRLDWNWRWTAPRWRWLTRKYFVRDWFRNGRTGPGEAESD